MHLNTLGVSVLQMRSIHSNGALYFLKKGLLDGTLWRRLGSNVT